MINLWLERVLLYKCHLLIPFHQVAIIIAQMNEWFILHHNI